MNSKVSPSRLFVTGYYSVTGKFYKKKEHAAKSKYLMPLVVKRPALAYMPSIGSCSKEAPQANTNYFL